MAETPRLRFGLFKTPDPSSMSSEEFDEWTTGFLNNIGRQVVGGAGVEKSGVGVEEKGLRRRRVGRLLGGIGRGFRRVPKVAERTN